MMAAALDYNFGGPVGEAKAAPPVAQSQARAPANVNPQYGGVIESVEVMPDGWVKVRERIGPGNQEIEIPRPQSAPAQQQPQQLPTFRFADLQTSPSTPPAPQAMPTSYVPPAAAQMQSYEPAPQQSFIQDYGAVCSGPGCQGAGCVGGNCAAGGGCPGGNCGSSAGFRPFGGFFRGR